MVGKRVADDERVDPRIRHLFATLLSGIDRGIVKSCLTGGEVGVGGEFKDREDLIEVSSHGAAAPLAFACSLLRQRRPRHREE